MVYGCHCECPQIKKIGVLNKKTFLKKKIKCQLCLQSFSTTHQIAFETAHPRWKGGALSTGGAPSPTDSPPACSHLLL